MLRIYTSTSAAAAKRYFSTADYYSEGQELKGVWRGEGAKRLGLSGEVEKLQWDRLCDNRNPDTGKSLTMRRKAERRVGWDFTFDGPKSLSVLYGLTGDERLLDAFRSAVDETMSEIETEAKCRVRKGGKNENRTTGELVWGHYTHFTSRPVGGIPDPQLHSHCFAFNATFDPQEQRFKAAEIAHIKRDAPYHQAAFEARLGRKLAELGLPIERSKGGWEIAGLDRAAILKFSRRTALIERKAKELGVTDAKQKGALGAQLRERKAKHLPMSELREVWRQRLTPDEASTVERQARAIGTEPIAERAECAKEAVDYAIRHSFERSAVVCERQVLAEALKHAVGRASPQSVLATFGERLLIRRTMDGIRWVTTPEALAEEQALLGFARSGRGTCKKFGVPAHVFDGVELSDEQRRAVTHLLTSTDRVLMIAGKAGTGKTTLMTAATRAIEQSGKHVFAFAPSAAASRGVLHAAGFTEADTVAQLMVDEALQERARDQVLWVDEASLLSVSTTKALFDLAERIQARVILQGDARQHGSVARGGVMRLLETEAGIMPAELHEIRRQSGAYRSAVRDLSDGRVAAGFRKLDGLGWIKELGSDERYDAVAGAYVQSVRRPGETLVVSPTHAEADHVTRHIRAALKGEHLLGPIDRSHLILRPVSLTEAQRADALSYQPGDVLLLHQNARGHKKGERLVVGRDRLPLDQAARFTVYRPDVLRLAAGDRVRITKNEKSKDGKRLNNGDLFSVKAVGDDGTITLDNGAHLPRGFGFLDHGYVVTSHASQGKTVARVIISQTADSLANSMQQFYVSASRARYEMLLFTDDKQALLDSIHRSEETMSATDLAAGRGVRIQRPMRHDRDDAGIGQDERRGTPAPHLVSGLEEMANER